MTSSAPDAPALLDVRGLSLGVADGPLVSGLDWRVQTGERWCVIGRNGAGKSLLLRALAGLSVPRREGRVHWSGRDQAGWIAPEAAAFRAYMPQQTRDSFALPVRRLLELGGVPDRIDGLLDALDIAALASRRIDRLSGGERQRVALAQCAVQRAALMLLDEPVSFQDPGQGRRVADWLRGIDASWIATAHDPAWIARAATHVLALTGGGAWQVGTACEMLRPETLERVYGCAWPRGDEWPFGGQSAG